ncbi:MAG: TIGR02646 family protein [Desulfobacteraceae bacterium]|nr:TIGR02646 family protein [Desulfobacteraceae bacterium]
MRAIIKGRPPKELTEYRLQPDAEYDGPNFTPVKAVIKEQLLKEQGYLCAYCMKRIDVSNMKIEHWQSQSNYSDAQLDYNNMLACCLGNEGKPPKEQTCDTRKGNMNLTYSPSRPDHRIESRIRYIADGKIISDEDVFNGEIQDVLNLNQARLISNRKVILSTIQDELNKRPGRRTKAEIRKFLSRWINPGPNGKFIEFSGVAIYDLNKRLRNSA